MKPLTEIELKLRDICHANPFISQKKFITKEELLLISERTHMDFSDLLSIPLNESLDEDTFFTPGENIGVIEHARYIPPLLHKHSFFELVYVREGECVHYVDNAAHQLTTGDICIVAPSHEHALAAFSDQADIINLQIRTSTFEQTFMSLFADKDVLSDFFIHSIYNTKSRTFITFRTGNDLLLKQISKHLSDEFNSHEKYRGKMMDTLISTFFIQLLRAHEKDVILNPKNNSDKDDNLIFMLQYIQNNYVNLSLSELARFFGYSERHTSRLIKNSTGKNFSEITKELRLKKAAELLSMTELSITDVMENVGYSDLSTFYKAFKGFYGITPAKYRNKILL